MNIGHKDFFQRHWIYGLNGCARIIAGRKHSGLILVGDQHGQMAASSYLNNAGRVGKIASGESTSLKRRQRSRNISLSSEAMIRPRSMKVI